MESIIAMSFFALSMSISPGPVNLVTLFSGLNNGFFRTVPFVLGASIGFISLLIFVGIALQLASSAFLYIKPWLSLVGSGLILYFGYRFITAKSGTTTNNINISTSFKQGALLQWLNPKAWLASIAGVTAFVQSEQKLVLFSTLYFVICTASILLWAYAGQKLSDLIKRTSILHVFNRVTGLLLVSTAFFILVPELHFLVKLFSVN